MGIDVIQNNMIKNPSIPNMRHLWRFFNLFLHHSFMAEQWKEIIVVPPFKNDKPPSDPILYRPVSLTYCVGKLFERVIGSRLNWFIEIERDSL